MVIIKALLFSEGLISDPLKALNRYLYDNSRDFKNNIDDEIGILKDFGVEFEVIR